MPREGGGRRPELTRGRALELMGHEGRTMTPKIASDTPIILARQRPAGCQTDGVESQRTRR